jgi:hypothetical protein
METKMLMGYIQLKAQIEGVPFDLNQEFFEDYFNMGVRNFFGVWVDEQCFPLYDEEEPDDYPGLLKEFIKTNLYRS